VPPRAYWKGYLKLSLVSCPIAVYPATSNRKKISFHQLHKQTGNRIKYGKVDAETGEKVGSGDIIKGYENGKGEYIQIEPKELKAIALERNRTIEISEFIPKAEIDELYFNSPYFIVPDGELGQQAFAVIREAIRQKGMVALGKVVFTTREHVIALEARGKGLIGMTLRYPYQMRDENEYFGHIEDENAPQDMLELASRIVEIKRGKFDPTRFEDRYEVALKDLLQKKQPAEKPPKVLAPSKGLESKRALPSSADMPPFRTLLTKMGVLTSTPVFFVLAAVFMAAWAFFSSEGIGWREIATMATLFMTILIQRAEHRDTQALHAKLDELIKADEGARNELTEIDKKDAEEIERHRRRSRSSAISPRLLG